MTHTKWKVNGVNSDKSLNILPEGEWSGLGVTPIARIPVYNDTNLQESNAKLIASAPELLEALKEVLIEIPLGNPYEYKPLHKAVKKAREAIKKAEG